MMQEWRTKQQEKQQEEQKMQQEKRQKQETSREVDKKNGTRSFKSYSKENFKTFHVDAAAIAINNELKSLEFKLETETTTAFLRPQSKHRRTAPLMASTNNYRRIAIY